MNKKLDTLSITSGCKRTHNTSNINSEYDYSPDTESVNTNSSQSFVNHIVNYNTINNTQIMHHGDAINNSGNYVANSNVNNEGMFSTSNDNTNANILNNMETTSMKQNATSKKGKFGIDHSVAIICAVIPAIIAAAVALYIHIDGKTEPEPPKPPISDYEDMPESVEIDFYVEKLDTLHVGIPYVTYSISCEGFSYQVIPYVYLSLKNNSETIYIPIKGVYASETYSSDENGTCVFEHEDTLGDFKEHLSMAFKNTKWDIDVGTLLAIQYVNGNSLDTIVYGLREGKLIPSEEEDSYPILLELINESNFSFSLQGWRQDRNYIISLITEYVK